MYQTDVRTTAIKKGTLLTFLNYLELCKYVRVQSLPYLLTTYNVF